MTAAPRTPVLVGAAQFLGRKDDPARALAPADMLAHVARLALADSGAEFSPAEIDGLAVIRLFADSSPVFASPFGTCRNLPWSVARRIGANPRLQLYGPVGGHTPQLFVNMLAERIAAGEADVVLIAGGEALRTQARAAKAGIALDWSEDAPSDPQTLGAETPLVSAHELRHGIALPVHVYPLFENAYAAAKGWTPAQEQREIGRLMAGFTKVAAANPYAQVREVRSAEALTAPSPDNRMIAWPYTKHLSANMFVDQAAAVLMMSTEAADRLGVPAARRVHLHGSADAHDHIFVSERLDYSSSPAIRVGARHALAQAGVAPADLSHIDIYSCFPVAVEIGASMAGLPLSDPERLTLTGGLPYFGGPGNAYSLHAIAEVVARCRGTPGSWGFVSANGGFLTKHSFGVYSTNPGHPRRIPPAAYQREIDADPVPPFTETPSGTGRIETFTVVYDGGKPAFALIVGRQENGVRFLAQLRECAEALLSTSAIGRRITVTTSDPANLAELVL
jgi:acetyl-CoA C-acetyltransferase